MRLSRFGLLPGISQDRDPAFMMLKISGLNFCLGCMLMNKMKSSVKRLEETINLKRGSRMVKKCYSDCQALALTWDQKC